MKILSTRLFALFVPISFGLTACSALGIPQAQTFNERAAVALSAVTSVRQATLTLLQTKRITADDAENVQKQADNARSAIDIARKLNAAGDPGAPGKLDQAQAVLTTLEAYLATKGKAP